MYKGVKVVLLALALLVGLAPAAPALAFAGHSAMAVSDCCAPAPTCDGPAAACAVQEVCQPGFPSALEQAQTPLFGGVADKRRQATEPPSSPHATAPLAAAPQVGPPLYLRLHRFLL
ncbi:MAG: hypothetical protein ACT4P3_15470 [Betaproteobacteria bacterium]